MGKLITYTLLGTVSSFAIIVHMSLMPHLMQLPGFANGVTVQAIRSEFYPFLLTLALSWIAWWSVSGLLAIVLYATGKYSWIVLFILSLGVIFGITALIT